jgi:competence protein ComEA
MRKFLKEYFSFSRSEIRIIIILSALIFFSLILRIFFPAPDFSKFTLTAEDNIAIDRFIESLEKIEYKKQYIYTPREKPGHLPQYRVFDPNLVTSQELEEMGFPDFIRKNLIRYREAGGKFKEKSDLKKLYGFSDSLFNLWQNYLSVPPSEEKDSAGIISFVDRNVEINSADSVELLAIKGIGPYYAGKIVSYRNRLGGYIKMDQLLEIRGMDEVKLENLKGQLIIDTLMIVQINLNSATLEGLKRHPYISYRLAESLVRYKQFAGAFNNIEELIENHLITDAEFEKLKPYIKVEQ